MTANRLPRLTWSDDNWPVETQVEISLSPTPGGTLVRVRHSGFERLTDGRRLATEHGAGWQLHLSNLRSLAEDGGSGERGVGYRLEVEPSDVVLNETRYGAFHGTDLDALLRERGSHRGRFRYCDQHLLRDHGGRPRRTTFEWSSSVRYRHQRR